MTFKPVPPEPTSLLSSDEKADLDEIFDNPAWRHADVHAVVQRIIIERLEERTTAEEAELRASVGDEVVDIAEALDDLFMSKGIALDDERLDWLAAHVAAQQAKALREVELELRDARTIPILVRAVVCAVLRGHARRADALASDRDERGEG